MRRDDGQPPEEGEGAKKDWVTRTEGPSGRVIVMLAALVLLFLFVLQNTEGVRIDFLFWHGRWPAWIVILLVAALGFVLGWVVATVRGRRRLRERDAG
jgi:uncharacterized integral membrane protein